MESLTPFIRHSLEDAPGSSGTPDAASSRVSPPLGKPPETQPEHLPPSQPDDPDVQLPPPAVPEPRPVSGSQQSPTAAPTASFRSDSKPQPFPMTDGTPVACRQKNATEFLAGHSPGVMTQYGDGLFGAQQHKHSRSPAPEEDREGVLQLVEWREEAPYG